MSQNIQNTIPSSNFPKNFCVDFNQSQIQLLQSLNIWEQVQQCVNQNQVLQLIVQAKERLQTQIYDNVHSKEVINPYKMTMIDPASLQKSLQKMVKNGCEAVVVEVSSQGLEQNRHWGLGQFSIGSFINLYPEHIESHGSFENYKRAKMKLFESLKPDAVAIANGEDQYADEMLNIAPSTVSKFKITKGTHYNISPYSHTMFKTFAIPNQVEDKSSFLMADFEVENVVLAGNIADQYLQKYHTKQLDYTILYRNYFTTPGRMEWVVRDSQVLFKVKQIG
jgi:UDP-N-acetylmuramyl tripeptide synthase